VSKPPDDCDCKLNDLVLTCSHGRTAKDQLLMVVSDHALGDKISVKPLAVGDCATKLVVRADGKAGYPSHGTQATEFRMSEPVSEGVTSLYKTSPVSTMVTAEVGGSTTQTVQVQAYPSKKASYKLDIKKLRKEYKTLLSLLPIQDSGSEGWELKTMEQSISAEAQWAEEPGSHLAFCEMSVNGGLDPFLGVSREFLLWGVPIPPKLTKYITAGLYLNVDFGASLTASCSWSYWPHDATTKWKSMKAELSGSGSAELAAELMVLEKALSAKAAGKSQASLKGWGEKENGEIPAVAWMAEWKPLTVSAVDKVAWGLFETEHAWPIFAAIKTDDHKMALWDK
jgi:hypothetical protein